MLPGWAAEREWGYGPDDAQYEELYAEIDLVLARYPDVCLTLPHFYFLSGDLRRAGALLAAHPKVCRDSAGSWD